LKQNKTIFETVIQKDKIKAKCGGAHIILVLGKDRGRRTSGSEPNLDYTTSCLQKI
jgi:hypothetical protein